MGVALNLFAGAGFGSCKALGLTRPGAATRTFYGSKALGALDGTIDVRTHNLLAAM